MYLIVNSLGFPVHTGNNLRTSSIAVLAHFRDPLFINIVVSSDHQTISLISANNEPTRTNVCEFTSEDLSNFKTVYK